MIMFLDDACTHREQENRLQSLADLMRGRFRRRGVASTAKIMTASAIILGLLPIMWSHWTGADVMKRIAAPMIGGMLPVTLLTLLVIPSLYFIWRSRSLKSRIQRA